MKRLSLWIALTGLIASILLGVSILPGERSQAIGKVYAQESVLNPACSLTTLKGTYGFFRTGTVPAGPLAAVGVATFDGNGSSTARQTIRKSGITTSDLFADPPLVSLYQVDRDCTGEFLTPDGSVFAHIVIVDAGKELFGISLSDENTVTGVWKKMDGGQE